MVEESEVIEPLPRSVEPWLVILDVLKRLVEFRLNF